VHCEDEATKCSVILTVYKRREFVEQALDSLESQSVDKNLFEVLIISNVELKFEKNYNINLRLVLSNRMSLAGKLAEGILIARNEIITFLEDDDLYCKDRIKDILTVFSGNKDLDYYHNRSVHFRTFTSPHKILETCSQKKSYFSLSIKNIENEDMTEVVEYKLNRYQADYNLSSMAIRKALIADYIELFLEVGTRYIDSFIFSIALYKGNSIIIDTKINTLIRTHSMNTSQGVEPTKETGSNGKYSIDMEKIVTAFIKMGIIEKRFVQHFITTRGLDDLMKADNISRVEVFYKMKKLLKLSGRNILRNDVTIKAFIYCISPTLMHKLLVRFHSI
jgi:glycosyltransferase involved in cell wall biosynthesis